MRCWPEDGNGWIADQFVAFLSFMKGSWRITRLCNVYEAPFVGRQQSSKRLRSSAGLNEGTTTNSKIIKRRFHCRLGSFSCQRAWNYPRTSKVIRTEFRSRQNGSTTLDFFWAKDDLWRWFLPDGQFLWFGILGVKRCLACIQYHFFSSHVDHRWWDWNDEKMAQSNGTWRHDHWPHSSDRDSHGFSGSPSLVRCFGTRWHTFFPVKTGWKIRLKFHFLKLPMRSFQMQLSWSTWFIMICSLTKSYKLSKLYRAPMKGRSGYGGHGGYGQVG